MHAKGSPQPIDHDLILMEAAKRYALAVDQLHPVMVDEGTHVYAYEREGRRFVLKWIPGDEKSVDAIRAELAWVNDLASELDAVCRAIPSPQGELVEVIDTGTSYVSVFSQERAEGHRPEGADLTADLVRAWGEVMGRMHAHAKHYHPPRALARIPAWDADADLARAHIPADQTLVLERYDALLRQVRALPQDVDSYGLIHSDFQANNIVVADGKLSIFDFGACEYNWYVSDIAIALYFHLWEPHPGQANRVVAADFVDHLLEGYTRVCPLDDASRAHIPLFLKLQEMNVYVEINRFNAIAAGTDLESISPRYAKLLQNYRQHIEHEIPYIDSAYNPWQS